MDRNHKARAEHKTANTTAAEGVTAGEYFRDGNSAVRRHELLWAFAWLEQLRKDRAWYRRLWRWARGRSEQNLWPWELLVRRRDEARRKAEAMEGPAGPRPVQNPRPWV